MISFGPDCSLISFRYFALASYFSILINVQTAYSTMMSYSFQVTSQPSRGHHDIGNVWKRRFRFQIKNCKKICIVELIADKYNRLISSLALTYVSDAPCHVTWHVKSSFKSLKLLNCRRIFVVLTQVSDRVFLITSLVAFGMIAQGPV